MQGERKPMRYAHAEGHTDLCYVDDGKQILTCGSDGDVRIWKGIEDDDPSSQSVGEIALSVAYGDQRFFVGTDNNYVQAYTFPDAKRDGIISRFSAPVTHIEVSKDGSFVVSCSCDMEVQVSEVATNKITKLTGHTGPILGVALDPKLKYVASSSCDGSVRIWEVENGTSVKTFQNAVPTCNDFFTSERLCRPAWQTETGSYLAFPKEKEVVLYERDSWSLKYQLNDPGIEKALSIVLFSPCGNYLAASSISGEIVIWDVYKQSKMSYTVHPKKCAISGMAWNPTSDEIAFCDKLGQLGTLENFTKKEPTVADEVQNGDAVDVDGRFDDDDDDENVISIEKIKASSGWISPAKMNEDQSSDTESRFSEEKKLTPLTEIQIPFQPSATPTHFQHRFMLWNSVGVVRCFNTEEEKSIDVEFHDTMFHHALHMTNYDDYSMAALSDKVLSLASSASDETISKLTCVLLNAWDGSKEWSYALLDGENVTAVAASGNWVAVATDVQHLRFFTHAGTQRQILSIPGPVLSMAGHEQKLMVVYHSGMGLPGYQNLSFILYEISNVHVRALTPSLPVAVFPKSTLKWIGFSDEGTPCAFDSEGILRFLSRDSLHWLVGCDTRLQCKSKADHYFIIGVSEKFQNIRCILCKGSYYPTTTPRPTVIEIPLKLPLCEIDSEKSLHEDAFWRLIFSLPVLRSLRESNECENEADNMEKTLKQTIIKLFANACRADADMRAVDVSTFMCEQPLQMAAKYASKTGKMYLAEKLGSINPVDWNNLNESVSFFHDVTRMSSDHCDLEKTVRVNYSQQDMFEDPPPVEENRLLAAAADSKDNFQNSSSAITPTRINPFRKKDKQDNGPKGLSFFDRPFQNKPENQGNEKLQANKSKPLTGSKEKANNSQPKKPTFVQWFALRKAALKAENAELSTNELTKLGMKIFREECNKSTESQTEVNKNDSQDSNDTQITESKKRKLDQDEVNGKPVIESKKSAAKKLSSFAFTKS